MFTASTPTICMMAHLCIYALSTPDCERVEAPVWMMLFSSTSSHCFGLVPPRYSIRLQAEENTPAAQFYRKGKMCLCPLSPPTASRIWAVCTQRVINGFTGYLLVTMRPTLRTLISCFSSFQLSKTVILSTFIHRGYPEFAASATFLD